MQNGRIFQDRTEAGQLLAEVLASYKSHSPLVLALPRGGVPIGYEIARKLHSPLDLIVVRKIGAPFNREFGVGALAPPDILVFDNEAMQTLGLQPEDLKAIIEEEREEMKRRQLHYRSGEWSQNTEAKTIVVVDDGLATGVTARAALEAVKKTYHPKELIFASPVCAADSIKSIEQYVDRIICLSTPLDLIAIGVWYRVFNQVTDEAVIEYLTRANKEKTFPIEI